MADCPWRKSLGWPEMLDLWPFFAFYDGAKNFTTNNGGVDIKAGEPACSNLHVKPSHCEISAMKLALNDKKSV